MTQIQNSVLAIKFPSIGFKYQAKTNSNNKTLT